MVKCATRKERLHKPINDQETSVYADTLGLNRTLVPHTHTHTVSARVVFRPQTTELVAAVLSADRSSDFL